MNTSNLHQRLSAIMGELGAMKPQGHNSHSNYDYITYSQISEAARLLFVKHGVFMTPSLTKHTTTPVLSAKGNQNLLSEVEVTYTFYNIDKPEDYLAISSVGQGMDTGDKAVYKALTGAHKYMLFKTFNVGTDDDAEKESPEIGIVIKKTNQIPDKPKDALDNIF